MEEQNKAPVSDAEIISTTAIKTVYWLVIVLSLALTLFYMLFPYTTSRMYYDLGDYYKAYDCASRAGRVSDGKRKVNAMLDSVNYSALIFDGDEDFATEVEKSTQEFLSSESCRARISLIDEYNLSSSAKIIRPNLFSYEDYLYSLNAKARASKGETTLLYKGEYLKANELIVSVESVKERAILFSQIATVIEKTGKTEVVNTQFLLEVMDEYISDALAETDELTRLYLVKAYEKLFVRLVSVNAIPSTVMDLIKLVSYEGQTYEITDLYYNKLLLEYCK